MADKFPNIPRMPKRVKEWMKTHSVADLEAAMWELDDKRAELAAEILSIMYELTDDIVGVEVPKVEVFA
ncbi:MAG: hypothetical protein GXO25_07415 [Euryarchaeota archaeon]|nr:hypothetical protein [Euryarchaeota archaeon]